MLLGNVGFGGNRRQICFWLKGRSIVRKHKFTCYYIFFFTKWMAELMHLEESINHIHSLLFMWHTQKLKGYSCLFSMELYAF